MRLPKDDDICPKDDDICQVYISIFTISVWNIVTSTFVEKAKPTGCLEVVFTLISHVMFPASMLDMKTIENMSWDTLDGMIG